MLERSDMKKVWMVGKSGSLHVFLYDTDTQRWRFWSEASIECFYSR